MMRGAEEHSIFAYVIPPRVVPVLPPALSNGSMPGCAQVSTAHIWTFGARGMVGEREARVGRGGWMGGV